MEIPFTHKPRKNGLFHIFRHANHRRTISARHKKGKRAAYSSHSARQGQQTAIRKPYFICANSFIWKPYLK
jgi:hypothetical protein